MFKVADYKEVFMLFDRDEDGVLSFQELQVVMKSMGQRPSGPARNTFNELFLSKKYFLRRRIVGEGTRSIRGLSL